MSAQPIRVLCIEDNPGDVMLVKVALAETGNTFVVEWADRLSRGLDFLAHETADAVLLDLGLPDSRGLETLIRVQKEAPSAPVVVLTSLEDDPSEVKALTAGAQDYLNKDMLEGESLARAIRHAIERAHLLASEQSARAEAERANLAKDVMLATVSHELRSPLQTILGWTQVLQQDACDGQELQRALAVIERCAIQQSRLVEDLLDASRVVTGTMRLELRSVRIVDVVRAALDMVEHVARAKGIHLVLDVPRICTDVLGDAARLQQVVGNLVSNAVKFTQREGTVRVQLSEVRDRMRMVVQDTGTGIPADLLPHVFERFRKGPHTGGDAGHGLGLGLAIAHHIVTLHGGSILAGSAGPGKGAAFTVEIPRVRSAGKAQQP